MARGGNNNNRGGGRFRGRGQGRGRGRGASPFRGRDQTPRGAARPQYHRIDVDIQQWDDEEVNATGSYPQRGRGGKAYNNRGRGRGSGTNTPNYIVFANNSRTPPPPRAEGGSGYGTLTGRGKPRGAGLGSKLNANISLTKFLALDRPFLRPITFVPAQITPFLFKDEEELIQVEPFVEPEDHVPTAGQVTRIFTSQKSKPATQQRIFDNPNDDLFDTGDDSAPIATVDFGSLGDFMQEAQYDVTAPNSTIEAIEMTQTVSEQIGDEGLPDVFVSTVSTQAVEELLIEAASPDAIQHTAETIAPSASESTTGDFATAPESIEDSDTPQFFFDPNPSTLDEVAAATTENGILPSPSLEPPGSALPDDDIVVYDAPLPRSREQTPNKAIQTLPAKSPSVKPVEAPPPSVITHHAGELNVSFAGLSTVVQANRVQAKAMTPRGRRLTKKDRQRANKGGFFGSYGVMLEEKHLHEGEDNRKRREGSDIDWGDTNSDSEDQAANRYNVEESDIDKVSSNLGAMDLDTDIDMEGMQSFVKSMTIAGMEHTTMDDIDDAEQLRLEDEDSEGGRSEDSDGEDSEIEAIYNAELDALVGEDGEYSEKLDFDDSEEDEDSEEDDDETPRRKWQAHLERVRQKAKGKARADPMVEMRGSPGGLFQGRISKLQAEKARAEDSDEELEDDRDDFDEHFGWYDNENEYIGDIQELLDEHDTVVKGRNRKQRNTLFTAIRDGEFDSVPAKKQKDKGKDLPEELRAVWENDRVKKAENKRLRALTRQQVAIDPFSEHRGGKKGRKSMLTALRHASTDPLSLSDFDSNSDQEALQNPAPDMPSLVVQIRLYLSDLGNRAPMSLPPMDKESRAKVHEIAEAFGLKSKSVGKGEARYTRLIKTSRSGVGVNERKVARIVKSGGDWGFTRPDNRAKGKGGGGGAPRQREGDEVGKAAPKIGESNVGFKMLAGMGWAEGQRIGVSAPGLEVPLTAIIKNTKLGLGATR